MTSESAEVSTAKNVSFSSKFKSEVTKMDTHCNSCCSVGAKTMSCDSGEKSIVSKE